MFSYLLKLSDVKILILFFISIIFVGILLLIFFGYIDYFFNFFQGKKVYTTRVVIDDTLNQEFYHNPNSSTLWVLIPSWGEELDVSDDLKDDIIDRGFSYLHYEFPKEILSSDYELTKDNFNNINDLITTDIKKLKKEYEFSNINIMGVSIGTSNLFTVANNNSDLFTKIVAIVPGNSLAECMWKGILTKSIRKEYEKQKIDLPFLENQWESFAPKNNLDNLSGKDIHIYLSKADKVIPYECGIKLISLMREKNITFSFNENKYLGHYGTAYNAYFTPDFLDSNI